MRSGISTNMDNTLSRLISLGAKPPANTQVADEDLFTPRGPRLGFSGSLGTPPPLPVTKKVAAAVAAQEKEKLKKAAAVEKDDVDDEYDDEKGTGSRADEEEEQVEGGRIELLDMNVDDEESLGEYEDDYVVSDNDDDAEEDYSDIPPIISVVPLKKKTSIPAPRGEATAPSNHKKQEKTVSDYESLMRRFLRKNKDTDSIPSELVTWLGPCSEEQLHEHQVALTRLHAAATTGTTSAQNALTQLSTHAPQLGVGSEAYDKALKPYCAVSSYCDLDLFQDILEGNYQLNEEEGV
jgi:hypothetical protein